jgi:hypothetical protein
MAEWQGQSNRSVRGDSTLQHSGGVEMGVDNSSSRELHEDRMSWALHQGESGDHTLQRSLISITVALLDDGHQVRGKRMMQCSSAVAVNRGWVMMMMVLVIVGDDDVDNTKMTPNRQMIDDKHTSNKDRHTSAQLDCSPLLSLTLTPPPTHSASLYRPTRHTEKSHEKDKSCLSG